MTNDYVDHKTIWKIEITRTARIIKDSGMDKVSLKAAGDEEYVRPIDHT
jgi:hypothetical protein